MRTVSEGVIEMLGLHMAGNAARHFYLLRTKSNAREESTPHSCMASQAHASIEFD